MADIADTASGPDRFVPGTEGHPPRGVAWTEIGRLAEAISSARRALFSPVDAISETYALGSRGIWVLAMIGEGRIQTPTDLARMFGIPKSMATEQIALLARQDLVAIAQAETDRRRKHLSLTRRGQELNRLLATSFEEKLEAVLRDYSMDDLALCIRLLNDIANTTGHAAG